MANQRKLEVVITGDSRQLERAFGRAGKSSESFGRKLTRGAGKGMLFVGKTGAVAAVAGVAAVGVGLVKSAKAASEAEASNARLAAQLKSMGKNSVETRNQIEDTVQSLSRLGAFDDEDLQDAFTTLVRSSGNVAKSQKDLGLVADVARGAQLDLATAAKLVNRVNAGNVGSLKRYGIALEEGATKEEAIAALRAKFAGQAEAYGNTAAGAQEAFRVASENALEQVGVALTPLIVEFAKFAQDVLPKVATAVSVYLGQAIAWLKQNWPQIRAILVGVWEALRFAFVNIVQPVARGIITAIGAVVGFFRANMPAIKATTQAAFGWIQTNIVPTVRTVANGVARLVGFMTEVWRNHGETIKAILRPFYNAAKEIITSALVIIRESIEFWLALIRGDWAKAFDSLKTMVGAALRGVTAVIRNVGGAIVSAAANLGSRLIDGIVNAIRGGASRLKSTLEQMLRDIVNNLRPFSPVEHGGAIIAGKLTDGMIVELGKRRGKVAAKLSEVVRGVVMDARGNLSGLTGGLASMLGAIYGESSADAVRAREIRNQQRETERQRERERLDAAIAQAETDEERAQAQRDLDDWLLDQEAQRLEESVTQQQAAYERNIANLTAEFNNGAISAQKFRDELTALVGGNTGMELGYAFASEFGAQVQAVANQIAALIGFPTGAGGPGVTSPAAAQLEEQLDAWRKRRGTLQEALRKAREDARADDSAEGKKVTPAEQKRIDKAKAALDAHLARKPKALAMGGVLRRAVLAGEAGPEAVLPLSSGRAQRMLAEAMDAADRINGRSGGTTVVHVTVNGNEFSAREFARKLKPELDRVVGFGTV